MFLISSGKCCLHSIFFFSEARRLYSDGTTARQHDVNEEQPITYAKIALTHNDSARFSQAANDFFENALSQVRNRSVTQNLCAYCKETTSLSRICMQEQSATKRCARYRQAVGFRPA